MESKKCKVLQQVFAKHVRYKKFANEMSTTEE